MSSLESESRAPLKASAAYAKALMAYFSSEDTEEKEVVNILKEVHVKFEHGQFLDLSCGPIQDDQVRQIIIGLLKDAPSDLHAAVQAVKQKMAAAKWALEKCVRDREPDQIHSPAALVDSTPTPLPAAATPSVTPAQASSSPVPSSTPLPITSAADSSAQPVVPTEKAAHTPASTILHPPAGEKSLAPTQPTPPKPAAWVEKEAAEPWCPPEWRDKLEKMLGGKLADLPYNDSAASVFASGWYAVAATRRGRLHAHNAGHREDAFHIETGDGLSSICVADGAGSYKFSRIGATVSCRVLARLLKEAFANQSAELIDLDDASLTERIQKLYQSAVAGVCKSIRTLAEEVGVSPKLFRCTMLAAVLWKPDHGQERFFLCQVGDGFAASRAEDDRCHRHGTADSGEWSGEVGAFLPDEEAPKKAAASVEVLDAENIQGLILCTDGVEDPFYPIESNAFHIFSQLYNGVAAELPGFEVREEECRAEKPILGQSEEEAKARLQEWLRFKKRGENDDRTIAVIYRTPVTRMPETPPPAKTAPDNAAQKSRSEPTPAGTQAAPPTSPTAPGIEPKTEAQNERTRLAGAAEVMEAPTDLLKTEPNLPHSPEGSASPEK